MKKILFILLASILTMSFTTKSTPIKTEISQENSIKAFIYSKGQWHTGYITYQQTSDSYVLISYSFNTLEKCYGCGHLNGSFADSQKFNPLNPNNEYAKNYNYTHYIDIQGFRAYITA